MHDRRVYRQVAQLHIDCIHEGFISRLGLAFVALMYQAIDECATGVLLVEERDGAVVGFVAGTSRIGQVYRQLLRHWFRLALALAPAIVQPRKLLRILEILRYGSPMPTPTRLPEHELLSMAVAPSVRGSGCSERLFRRLERHFREEGAQRFRILVGESLGPAQRFYRRMGAVATQRIELHRGAASTIYVRDAQDGQGSTPSAPNEPEAEFSRATVHSSNST